MKPSLKNQSGNAALGLLTYVLFILTFWVVPISAWVTHVIHTLNSGEWLLLIAGALVFPVGVIHGIGLWFGAF